jgi:hypothetical protein
MTRALLVLSLFASAACHDVVRTHHSMPYDLQPTSYAPWPWCDRDVVCDCWACTAKVDERSTVCAQPYPVPCAKETSR